jgi:hypothetical protein
MGSPIVSTSRQHNMELSRPAESARPGGSYRLHSHFSAGLSGVGFNDLLCSARYSRLQIELLFLQISLEKGQPDPALSTGPSPYYPGRMFQRFRLLKPSSAAAIQSSEQSVLLPLAGIRFLPRSKTARFPIHAPSIGWHFSGMRFPYYSCLLSER